MSDHIPDTGKMVPDAWMEAADRVLVPGKPMTTSDLRKALAAVAPLIAAAERERVAALVEALEAADQFIRNGIELGFIRMPDASTPDPALKTPAKIEAALALYRGEAGR